jgi:hypothetical protein
LLRADETARIEGYPPRTRPGRCWANYATRKGAPQPDSGRWSGRVCCRPLPLQQEVVIRAGPEQENRAVARLPKPSAGLEPATPSLPSTRGAMPAVACCCECPVSGRFGRSRGKPLLPVAAVRCFLTASSRGCAARTRMRQENDLLREPVGAEEQVVLARTAAAGEDDQVVALASSSFTFPCRMSITAAAVQEKSAAPRPSPVIGS